MSHKKKEPSGCGCANIPFSVIIIFLGGCYWLFTQRDNLGLNKFFGQFSQITSIVGNSTPITTSNPSSSLPSSPENNPQNNQEKTATNIQPVTPKSTPTFIPIPDVSPVNNPDVVNTSISPTNKPLPQTWAKKVVRGIYLSRYNVTNNTDENTIRQRVRYYRSQGFNTLIHGVWGNGCAMYNSQVMRQTIGYKSCPNEFQYKWLDWLIDEAHKQGMEVHAYFERGIKIDKTSPIYNLAVTQKWLVPGIDKTYPGIDHYILNVEVPDVANYLTNTLVEFVQRYPKIDAIQWDDYLAYHADLPGNVDRTPKLTAFMQKTITAIKKANPSVSFDICHHNPYWAKRYFAADWQKWNVDRVFIQAYNDANFQDELSYVKQYDGIAISEKQFHRLKGLLNDSSVKSILIFPLSGKPEETASSLNSFLQNVTGVRSQESGGRR
jgi:hypothetical protein